MLIFTSHNLNHCFQSRGTRSLWNVFEVVQNTRSTCFIGFKNTRLRLVFLNPIKHCCSCFKQYINTNKTFNKRKNRALLSLRRSQKTLRNIQQQRFPKKHYPETVKIGNNRNCVIQSWLSAWVVRDFISHSLHSVVAWFAIGDFWLPCSKEKRYYNWPFRRIYIWISSKGFDQRRGFIFPPENSTLASGKVNMIFTAFQ